MTDAAALDDLRWHYGDAYLIELIGDRWIAQRRDSRTTMSAEGPDRLLGLIRADYAAHPVPRAPCPVPRAPCPVTRARAGSGQMAVK